MINSALQSNGKCVFFFLYIIEYYKPLLKDVRAFVYTDVHICALLKRPEEVSGAVSHSPLILLRQGFS